MKQINPYVFPGIKKEDLIFAKFPHVGVLHPKLTVDDVFEIVQKECEVTLDQLVSKCRKGVIVKARHILCNSLREKCKLGVTKIGYIVGERDHTTAVHSLRVYSDLYQTDANFRDMADRVNSRLGLNGSKNN